MTSNRDWRGLLFVAPFVLLYAVILVFPLFRKQSLPAFQAAPWYLYWPYNGHFQTPAPLYGQFYAPPGMGGYGAGPGANPYFQQVAPPAAAPAPAQPGK